jgi:LPS export ABC transporter permease LptF/LPS export ABC transporter permease LptG
VSIVDRYVIRQILMPFLLGLLVFTFIFIIPEVMKYAEGFIAKGVSPSVVLQAMAQLVPYALGLTIPMSLLLGLLVAFGRLSADREFVALQACGISLMRLLRPVGLVSLLCWAATSYVFLFAIPTSNQAFREIAFNIVADRAEGEVKPRVFFDEFPDLVLYVRDVPASGAGWDGVFMADTRAGQVPATYLAKRGRVVIDRSRKTVEAVLENGWRHTVHPSGEYRVLKFDSIVVSLNPSTMFPAAGLSKGDNEMTIAELRAKIAQQEKAGDSTHNQWMAIHRKFAIPVACLVFGLMGLALGATNRRDGTLGSFVFALAVVFAYYVPFYLGPALAKGGHIPPWLAVWMSNIVLGALGVVLFIWRDRVADQPIRLPLPAFLQRAKSGGRERRMPLISVLDWYVAQRYGGILLLSACAMAGIFYIATFIDLSDKVFKGDATWQMLAAYFWYATPQYLYYIIALSVLLATLVTVAVLTKNSELIVMKACGISLYRIALPMLVAAIFSGAALFALEQTILGPWNRRAEAIQHVMRGGSPETFDVFNRRWVVGTDGKMIYNYNYFDPRTRTFSGLSIYELTDGMQRLVRRTSAELAIHADGAATPGVWRVERGWTRDFDEQGQPRSFTPFNLAERQFETADYFATDHPEPAFMSYSQLRGYTRRLEASGVDVTPQRVALARKISFPFVTIVMTLLAVPFAVTIGRSGAMAGIAVGIVLAITYWTANSVFAALGTGGLIAPVLAAWAPNLLFGAGAAYLLLTVRT